MYNKNVIPFQVFMCYKIVWFEKEMRNEMKKWKKQLCVWAIAAFAVWGCARSAQANPMQPYDRSQAVASEELERKARAVGETRDSGQGKAWQKINGVCYNGSGEVIPGAITRGIDVSEWQGEINWKKVKKSNVDFAFVRVAYGLNYMDKTYDYNMRQANAVGMPVGVYIYSTATTTADALKEAKLVINKIKGYTVSYPVVFDMECSRMGDLSGGQIAQLANTFCDEIRKAGYYPMVYCNTYWYSDVVDMSKLSGIDVWIARYGDTIQAPSKRSFRYTIWQSTDGDGGGVLNPTKGLIAGIPVYNNVDLNFGFVDYTKKITPRREPVSSYTPTADGWVKENGKTYYYKNGQKLTGSRCIGGKYYMFDSKDGHLFKNTLLYSSSTGRVCYVDENGLKITKNWVNCNGKRYYMGADGYAYKGSRCVDGKFYLFDSKRGYAFTNRRRIDTMDGSIYYYGPDGARYNSGFVRIEENGRVNTYYFNKQGKAYKQWHTIKGKKYYFYPGRTQTSGVRAENVTLTIDGMICKFDRNGVCISQKKADD